MDDRKLSEMSKLPKLSKLSELPKRTLMGIKIGGIAAIIAGVLFRKNWSAELSLMGVGPSEIPHTALGWLTFLNEDPIIGMIYLDFLDIINYLLVGLLFVALFLVLRNEKADKTIVTCALVIGLSGIVLFCFSNPSISMFYWSNRYFQATSEQEKLEILVRAENLLAIHNPGVFKQGLTYYLGQLFFAIAGMMFSIIMIKRKFNTKGKGALGIVAHGILLSYFVLLFVVPELAYFAIVLAAVPLILWQIFSGIKMVKLVKMAKIDKHGKNGANGAITRN
jgi:Domain of unknown function (DUF4386)